MNDINKKSSLFLNQMAGPLFRELAEDISKLSDSSELITGHPDSLEAKVEDTLKITKAPEYNRKSSLSRVLSWFNYFITVFVHLLFKPKKDITLIVSNPPFLGLIGLFFKLIKSSKYSILVYDIHPNILINAGKLNPKSIISLIWLKMNKLVYENAEIVFVLTDGMKAILGKQFDISKTRFNDIAVVPPWADIEKIKPLPKHQNPFTQKYNLSDKFIILYSGNFGATHDLESVMNAAYNLQDETEIHFLFIGSGAKWQKVKDFIESNKLKNATILPFLPEEELPFSLPAADLSIITMEHGTEGLMMPSKTYYSLAAGSALGTLCPNISDLAELVKKHQCGFSIEPNNEKILAEKISELYKNKEKLNIQKKNSRSAAEKYYSRSINTGLFIEYLRKLELL